MDDLDDKYTHWTTGETNTLGIWMNGYESLHGAITDKNYLEFATWARKHLAIDSIISGD